jgi:hypothetical protein
MSKIAMAVFAVVFFLVLGVGGATAAEKAKPSKDVTSTSPGAEKAKLPKDVTSTPTGKVLNDLGKGNQPAGHVFDGRKGNPPPVRVNKPTSTRTPQQAIDEYKKSGPPPSGNKGLKIKPPPPPSAPPKKK